VLVHSMHAESPLLRACSKRGASGYITKDSEPEQLLAALRKVAAGEGTSVRSSPNNSLSATDRQAAARAALRPGEPVFFLLASGKTLKAIARELHLSPKTRHLQNENHAEAQSASDASSSATPSRTTS